MHTDNLTREEIKEILVYSASHQAAWQIINNFKSILWYKYSQGPGTWPSTSHIPPLHNTPKLLGLQTKGLTTPLLAKSGVCNNFGSSQEKCKIESQKSSHQWMQHPSSASLGGQGDSVHQQGLTFQLAKPLRDTRNRSNHLPFPAEKGCWA